MKNLDYETLKAKWQKEWNEKGEKYAKEVNDMVAFAEVHGWDAYEGEDPVDEREGMTQLCEAVFELLKDANECGETLYLLEGDRVSEVAKGVIAVGKSKRNEIYALLRRKEIELIKGYDGRGGGEPIAKFSHNVELTYDEAEILPFNDGRKVLLAAHDGIF